MSERVRYCVDYYATQDHANEPIVEGWTLYRWRKTENSARLLLDRASLDDRYRWRLRKQTTTVAVLETVLDVRNT